MSALGPSVALAFATLMLASCGSSDGAARETNPPSDAALDGGEDVSSDANRDTGHDATKGHDGGPSRDAASDSKKEAATDAGFDAALPRNPGPPPTCNSGVTITPSNAATVQQGIDAAIKANCAGVVIPPGTYTFSGASPGGWYVNLRNVSNFEIYAVGVTFALSQANVGAFTFSSCTNVSLVGGLITHITPPSSQGTITNIGPSGAYFDITVHDGYYLLDDATDTPPATSLVGYAFAAGSNLWKAGTDDYYVSALSSLGGRSYRVTVANPQPSAPVVVGDVMAFRGIVKQDIYIHAGSGMNITGVTFTNASGFVVQDDASVAQNRFSYTVTYGPVPAGGTIAPVLASSADGFHSSSGRVGPLVEGCSFEGMPDDGIPIHGEYCNVTAAASGNVVTASTDCAPQAGDTLSFYDARLNFQTTAHVTTISGTRLTLDIPVAALAGWFVSNQNAVGSGFIVRNNTIRNHRARGLLIKASEGVILGNTISGSTIAGIVLSPESGANEADYVSNVVIRDNVIEHTGYASFGPATQVAALSLVSDSGFGQTTPGHRAVTIENNTFENEDGINLLILSADGVTVAGNTFVNAQQNATERTGFDQNALVWLGYSKAVSFESNTVKSWGSYGHTLVEQGPSTTAITGAATGVTVVP